MILNNFLQQVEISTKNRTALNANSSAQAFIASQQFDDLFNFVTNLLNDPALVNCNKKPEPKYIGYYSCYPTGSKGRRLLDFAPLNSNGNCRNDFWIARIPLEQNPSIPIYFPKQIIRPNIPSSDVYIEPHPKIDANGNLVRFAILKNPALIQHPKQFISISALQARLA